MQLTSQFVFKEDYGQFKSGQTYVLVTPLATVLIASTIFADMASFKRSYLSLLKGSIAAPTGEFLPGKRLDRALNLYPQFALCAILH